MGIELEASYPYLEFYALERFDPAIWIDDFGDEHYDLEETGIDGDGNIITFANGDMVFGPNYSDEYYFYVFGIRLNDFGQKLRGYVEALLGMGLLQLRDLEAEGASSISIAPWNIRDV